MFVVPQEIRGFQHGLREKGGSDVGVIWKRGQQYVVVYYDARGRRRWETIGPNKREAQQVLAERVWGAAMASSGSRNRALCRQIARGSERHSARTLTRTIGTQPRAWAW